MRSLAFLLLLAPLDPARGDELQPGLVAEYRGDGGETLRRVDPKPSFTWGASSPHPRIPPGPFRVSWRGVFVQPEEDTLRFGAFVGGKVRLQLDGVTVLEGRGDHERAWIASAKGRDWKPGKYPFEVEFESLAGVPARLQLFWEGKGFSREPLPPWRLKHAETDRPAREELVSRGRELAARHGCAKCHAAAFPGVRDPPPGPALSGLPASAIARTLAEGHAPALFSKEEAAEVARVARALGREDLPAEGYPDARVRDGKRAFLGLGCAACHLIPGVDPGEQEPRGRTPLARLKERWTTAALAAFLEDPRKRYPDGRMPRLPVAPKAASDIAAFLLASSAEAPRAPAEAGARDGIEGARRVIAARRCAACHPGVREAEPKDVPVRKFASGCMEGRGLPRYPFEPKEREALAAYLEVAPKEIHPSPFEERRRLLGRLGCARCHARDAAEPPPIEEIGSTLGDVQMHRLPFQRTPRLTNLLSKYRRSYVLGAVRDGVSGVRPPWYSYRMPAFGADAEEIVRALAEGDGELFDEPDPPPVPPADPTLQASGPGLVGFEGYSCVSCHTWKGQEMTGIDPGAVGPELTTVAARIRREWFDRWLEDPARVAPGTPMPQIFPRGRPAAVGAMLGGDPAKQKDALWAYFLKGKDAPSPRSLPPTPVPPPAGEALVSQIPLHLPDKSLVESITVLFGNHDLLVYDVGALRPRAFFTGAQLLRVPKDRRSFAVAGTPAALDFGADVPGKFLGYDRLPDGIRVRADRFAHTIRVEGRALVWGDRRFELPPAHAPKSPVEASQKAPDAGAAEGSLERPGYRAVALPRPKTSAGEDAVMPGAIAGHPQDGRVFVASMKTGDLFVVKDDRFENYARGLFQDAYGLLWDGDLYVLHRRNLTRVRDTDGDGFADAFDRVIALAHGVQENIDNAYGLVKEPSGAFVYTYAANTNRTLPGWGSILRTRPDGTHEEVSHGLRRAFGWTLGPENEIFFTDNQGEWVATSKFAHVKPGKFYGFPNPARREHSARPMAKTAVWIPYGWARSANGVAYDATGGKFGPFAGQFFLAEMMYGGAIVRVQVEKVNGQYQGAVFPFWGRGLLGPLVCAFDARGRLWVGSVTEASCMSQPDRGAVFRIEHTGETPFEIRSIHALPRGFRMEFTAPVDPKSAADPASYAVDHHRYEYTGAYGSPELDRTRLRLESATAEGTSVELTTGPLVADRVYVFQAPGVRSARGESLVHPTGAYTMNEIPRRDR